jgi:hypothetical protein
MNSKTNLNIFSALALPSSTYLFSNKTKKEQCRKTSFLSNLTSEVLEIKLIKTIAYTTAIYTLIY